MEEEFKKSGIIPVSSASEIKKLFGEPKIAMWNHEKNRGITWRIPDLNSPHEELQNIMKLDGFVIKEYEHAVVLRGGKLYASIPSGVYKLAKKAKLPGTEIIWIDKRQFKTNWGSPDLFTREGIKIGMHGITILRVDDPVKFVVNVLSAKRTFTEEDVKDWVRETVVNVLRSVLGNFPIEKALTERDLLIASIRAKARELFAQWGIELISLEVLGFNVPPEYEEIALRAGLEEYKARRKILRSENLMEDENG